LLLTSRDGIIAAKLVRADSFPKGRKADLNGKTWKLDMDAEERVGHLLREQAATLATAESCTGGLIGHLITNQPGSSDYFLGGVMAYANSVKNQVLGVRAETLAAVGAVSEQTALQMARGVCRVLGADYGLAVTGVAGPTGGTPEKPVGLVYIALVGPSVAVCERHIWSSDRLGNKELSARRAVQMLVEHLETASRVRNGSEKERPRGS
jgi:PncC family amidohydrolase